MHNAIQRLCSRKSVWLFVFGLILFFTNFAECVKPGGCSPERFTSTEFIEYINANKHFGWPMRYDDHGLALLVSFFSLTIGKLLSWISSYKINITIKAVHLILYCFFLAIGALYTFSLRRWTDRLLILSGFLFIIWLIGGPHNGYLLSFHWVVAWQLLHSTYILLLLSLKAKGESWWITFSGAILVSAIIPLFRQEAAAIVFALWAGILFYSLLSFLITRKARFLMWEIIPAFCMTILIFLMVRSGVRIAFAYGTKAAYSTVSIPEHGKGHPLYLSLGFAANPQNIVYNDYVATQHYRILTGGRQFSWTDPAYDRFLLGTFKKIIIEDPLLLLENIHRKTISLHQFLMGQWQIKEPPPRLHYAARTNPLFSILYCVLLITLLAFIVKLIKEHELTLIECGFLTASIGALAGPLLIDPAYPNGAYGILIVTAFIILPNSMISKRRLRTERIRFSRFQLLTALTIFILSVSAVFVLSWRKRIIAKQSAQKTLTLQKQSSRWSVDSAIAFNRLDLKEQDSFLKEKHRNVYCEINAKANNPDLNVYDMRIEDEIIYLILFVGSRPVKSPTSLANADVSYTVLISRNATIPTAVRNLAVYPDPNEKNFTFTALSEADWPGKYKIFMIPKPIQFETATQYQIYGLKAVSGAYPNFHFEKHYSGTFTKCSEK